MRLIFSKDRAAQLDLLLRSLERNAPPVSDGHTRILVPEVTEAYKQVFLDHGQRHDFATEAAGFDGALREALDDAGEFVTFFCDDDVLYRAVPTLGEDLLDRYEHLLTVSLRLGISLQNVKSFDVFTYPLDTFEDDGACAYNWIWQLLPPHDHGYPGSIDGHTFRVHDVLRMLDGQTIENPLMLETILAHRCQMLADECPLMACYPQQALVGVPVNTVADQAGRPSGDRHPQPAGELEHRFLDGERIDLDALDFSGVDGCLHEIPFVWHRP